MGWLIGVVVWRRGGGRVNGKGEGERSGKERGGRKVLIHSLGLDID